MPTETSLSGPSTSGTATVLGAQSARISQIPLDAFLVADASVDPTTTPSAPEARVQIDATGRCYLFYWTSTTGWAGVQMGATP